jgi:hypothetical protein
VHWKAISMSKTKKLENFITNFFFVFYFDFTRKTIVLTI